MNRPVLKPTITTGLIAVAGVLFWLFWFGDPRSADDFLTGAVFAIVCFAIGWLAARRIPHRPLLAAAAITTVAMLIALSLQFWARWEDVASFQSAEGRWLRLDLLALLAFFLIAAGIAALGAWVAIRLTRRA